MKLYRHAQGWWREEQGDVFSLPGFSLDRWLAEGMSGIAGPTRSGARGVEGMVAPIESQEVWAVGVTYLRSKKARMEESDFSASAYDKVYEAARPELFFKATPSRCVGT